MSPHLCSWCGRMRGRFFDPLTLNHICRPCKKRIEAERKASPPAYKSI